MKKNNLLLVLLFISFHALSQHETSVTINNQNMIGSYKSEDLHVSDYVNNQGVYDTTGMSNPEYRYQLKGIVPNWNFFSLAVNYNYKLTDNIKLGVGGNYGFSKNYFGQKEAMNGLISLQGNASYSLFFEKINNLELEFGINLKYIMSEFTSHILDTVPGYTSSIVLNSPIASYNRSVAIGLNPSLIYPVNSNIGVKLSLGLDYSITSSTENDLPMFSFIDKNNNPINNDDIINLSPMFFNVGLGIVWYP
jgi:hypothetical protein